MAGPGINLGTGFVNVVPSARGIEGNLARVMAAPAASAGRSSGRSWGQKFGTAVKVGAGVAATGAAAVVGTALVKGFQRLTAIETATAKLKGLGNSSKDVKVIMDGALKAVQGTAFGMDAAATSAAGAVAAGIKPGKQLNGVLKSMANAAAAAGVPMEEMGAIYNKVASTGKAQNDVLRQVADRGIPIYQALADKLGVTSDEVFKLATKGKIDFATFESAMKSASGTVADEMGKTTLGTLENLNAAMGRLGAGLLAGVFPEIQPLLGSLIGVVDRLTEAAAPAAEAVGAKLGPALAGVTKWLDGLDFTSWSNFTASLSGGGVSSSLSSLWDSAQKLAPAFGELGSALAQSGPEFANLATAGVDILSAAVGWLAEHMDTIVKWMPAIVGGLLLWRAASQGLASAQLAVRAGEVAMAPVYLTNQALRWVNIRAEQQLAASKLAAAGATTTQTTAENVGLFTKIRTVAATVAQRTATVATTVATRAAAAGQWLLNAAMSANPIGLIIAGIAALVAGLVWFFTQTKVGQMVIQTAWAGIKLAIGAVTTWFTTSVVPWFKSAINAIVLAFQAFKLGATIVWNGFKAVLGAVWNWVKTYVFNPIATFAKVTIPAAFNFLVTAVRLYINAWKLVLTTVWNFVKTYVFNPIKTFVMVTIPNAFNFMKRLVGLYINAWKLVINVAWTFVRDKIFSPLKHLVTVTIPFAFNLFKNLVKARMAEFRVGVHAAWTWVKDHTFSPLKTFITETIPNAFNSGVKAIGRFWDKLKSVASKPVKFVVDTVYNKGLVKMWNPIADFIGKEKWKLNKVDVSKFRSGGKVWGPGTETSDSIPARLSKNEHVLSAKDVRNLGGHGNVYALRAAAARGWTPGLATGGTLSDAARWLQAKGARITEFKAWGQRVGGHSKNSKHYTGHAFDANYGPGGQNATEQAFFDRVLPKMRELFPKLGYIWRAPGHYNHLHVDTGGGGRVGTGGSGGGGGWIPGLDTLVDWVKTKINGIGGDGHVASGMKTMATKLVDGMADKARSVFDVVGDAVENVKGGIVKGVAYAKGQTWATMNGLSGADRSRMNWIVSKESGWNPKAKNPRSTASGLPQFINSTARSYLGGSPASRFGVFDQLDGMRKYVHSSKFDDYGGGWKGAYNYWQKHHYYRDGGAVMPSLSMMSGLMPKPHVFDGGGWLTDRMVAVHGKRQPDAVLSSQQWADVHKLAVEDGGRAKGGVQLIVNFNGDIESRATAEKVVDDLSFEVKRIFGGGKYV